MSDNKTISILNTVYLICFDSYGELKTYKPEIDGEEHASSCLYRKLIRNINIPEGLTCDDVLTLHSENFRKRVNRIYNANLMTDERKLSSAINTQVFYNNDYINIGGDEIYQCLTIIQLIDLQCKGDEGSLNIDEIFKRFEEQDLFKEPLDVYLNNKYSKGE